MEHWHQMPPRSISPDGSSNAPPTWQGHSMQEWIVHALGRLEAGQQHNNRSGEERVKALGEHISTRIEDFREDMHRRIDGLEERIESVESRPQAPAPQSPPPPGRWWKDLPWAHILTLATATTVALAGHQLPAEVKSALMSLAGGK